MDFRKMTREFLLGEGKDVSVHSHVQSLMDILGSMDQGADCDTRRPMRA